jgi:hypothetical protein
MANFIKIENATIVSATTATSSFLTAKINNTNIGIPVFTFSDTTVELLQPTPSFDLINSTFYANATAYGLAIAFTVNTSSMCVPIYKLPTQSIDDIVNWEFSTPTMVGNVTSANCFMLIGNNDTNYGIPLYLYSNTQLNPSNNTFYTNNNINIDTVISVGKYAFDVTNESGSTYLNPKLEAYSDLIIRVKRMLGWPTMNLDLCDENVSDFIDTAIELYSKYGGYTEEFLVFNTSLYKQGAGIKLDDMFSQTPELLNTQFRNEKASYDYDLKNYRKVIDVWSFEQGEASGVNTLFTLEQALAQQTYFSYMLGNCGFDLITFEVLKGWLETREKVLAQKAYFRFDPKTQQLRILPQPLPEQNYYCVIGAYVEAPIRHLITEPWVYMYVLALTKIAIGQLRGKYNNMVIFGGGTLNANDMLSQGLKEKEELEKQLLTGTGFVDTWPAKFFLG